MPGTRRLVTVALVALACAACGPAPTADQALPDGPAGTAPPAGTPATTRPAAAPSPTEAVDGTDVLAVYRGWWQALEGAYARGDADDPALAEYAVDPILGHQRASICWPAGCWPAGCWPASPVRRTRTPA